MAAGSAAARSKLAMTTLDGLHTTLLATKLERLPDQEKHPSPWSVDDGATVADADGGDAQLKVIHGTGSRPLPAGGRPKPGASPWADLAGGRGGEADEATTDEVAVAPRSGRRGGALNALDVADRPIYFGWNHKYWQRKERLLPPFVSSSTASSSLASLGWGGGLTRRKGAQESEGSGK